MQTDDRSGFLGATDISALVGVNPYASPLSVFCEKTGASPPKEVTPAMKRGLRLEPYIAELYTDRTGLELSKAERVCHPSKTYLRATPDFIVASEPRYVEAKSHHWTVAHHYGEPGTDQAPDWEVIQATWQLHLANLCGWTIRYCDVAALLGVGEEDLRIFPVEYDPDLAAHLEEAADRFWHDHVLAGVPPAVSAIDSDLLKTLYPQSRERSVTATPEIEGVCAALRKARLARKEAESEVEQLEAEIKAFMQDAGVLDTSLGAFTWKTSKGSPRWKAIAEEMNPPAHIIARHTPEIGSRVFKVPFKGE